MLRVDGLRTCNVLSDSGGARFEDTCVYCAESIVGDLQRRGMGGWSRGGLGVVWRWSGVVWGFVWEWHGGGLGVVWGWSGVVWGWSGDGLGVAWGWSGVAGVGPVSIIGMPGVGPGSARGRSGGQSGVGPGSIDGVMVNAGASPGGCIQSVFKVYSRALEYTLNTCIHGVFKGP